MLLCCIVFYCTLLYCIALNCIVLYCSILPPGINPFSVNNNNNNINNNVFFIVQGSFNHSNTLTSTYKCEILCFMYFLVFVKHKEMEQTCVASGSEQ